MEFFKTLGRLVNERWKSKNYNEEAFCDVARSALSDLPPAEHVSLWDSVKWALTADHLPRQDDIEAKFGDPPLTVFIGRKFRIEVLFWTEGTPSIHQHAFSGAFHVLHGSSIHTLWNFEPTERIETRLLLGNVSFSHGEILQKGDSRPIWAGNKLYHSTYHVDRPSISVVVRTLGEADHQPQYSLLPPAMARATQDAITTVRRQLQLLRMLATAGRITELNEMLRHMFATKDSYSISEIFLSAVGFIEDDEDRQELLAIVRNRHRTLAEALEGALTTRDVGNRILALRRGIDSTDLRFFMALLRNVPERATIFNSIQKRVPHHNPVDTIVGWLRKLAEEGPPQIGMHGSALIVLRHLLLDHTPEEIQAALRREIPPNGVGTAALHDLCSSLASSWLLSSLCLRNPFDPVKPTVVSTRPSATTTAERELVSLTPGTAHDSGDSEPVNQYRCLLDMQPDPAVPKVLLHGYRSLPNERRWMVNPQLTFSGSGHCPDRNVAFSEAVTVSAPTVWVTDPVTSIVSPFVLGDTLAPIVASLRPGCDFSAIPSTDSMRRLAEAGLIYNPEINAEKQNYWRTTLERANEQFRTGYVTVDATLHPFTLGAVRTYYKRSVALGRPKYGDKDVPRRWVAHNEPVARFIHCQLKHIVEAVTGALVKPSYVYFASYHGGAQLKRHVDREQCEYSISMLVDYSPEPETESPWPLWLDTKSGTIAVYQRLGSMLIYRGRELPHFRTELPAGHTSTHLFLHYVKWDFEGQLN